jgi:hypothetical protein
MDADDCSDSDDSRELIDLNCYTQPEELEGEDSDTLPTPTRNATFSDSTVSWCGKPQPGGGMHPPKPRG